MMNMRKILDTTKVPVRPEWLREIKHDGYRLIAQRDGKLLRLWTRKAFENEVLE